jgi:Gamma-glutamyl cyclotransferase, AIG2-like
MALLFSYGTLQENSVQLSTFGRVLQGWPDVLVGFELSVTKIEDPAFVATSGKSEHAIVRFTGKDESRVTGMVFDVTDAELARSDAYEPAGYKRVLGTLASGKRAWVYARASLP